MGARARGGAGVGRVLVVVAHPDDAEFGCAGSVAHWVREGRQVAYLVATTGDKGSDDPAMTSERLATIREAEQLRATQVLGVDPVIFLRYPDGELEDTREFRREVVRAIRRFRPERLVTTTPLPTLNLYAGHRDHRTAGRVALDAVYPYARDHLHFPELLAEGLAPHKVLEVYLMGHDEPDLWVDISETLELKLKALRCHASQFSDPEAVEARVRQRAAELGQAKGIAWAEAFKRIQLPR